MLLVDAGTSYIKTFNIETKKYQTFNINELNTLKNKNVLIATGHNRNLFKDAKKINELIALSKGVANFVKDENYTVIDLGSRDIKSIEFKDNKFSKCNWNTSCGAMIGFTLELMNKYFNVNDNDLNMVETPIDITCGLLGITKFFDLISKNNDAINSSMSSLIFGMAKYTWNFSNKCKKIYLSGGLSENKLFISYLEKLGSEIIPLGRYVLIEGLKTYSSKI